MTFSHAELTTEQDRRLYSPLEYIEQDYEAVYEHDEVFIGWPELIPRVFENLSRNNTALVLGLALGDEGKGRAVDNIVQKLFNQGMRKVTVARFQGGSNSGHTLVTEQGTKVALHQVPSGILYEQTVGLMDSGMIIHMEDLQTEIRDAESLEEVGDLRGKLILSPEAMLCTDLERAQEVLNRVLSGGQSGGGTGMGIGPTAANALARRGFRVQDLFNEGWRNEFEIMYDLYDKEFAAHGQELAEMDVPDLVETRKQKKAISRKLGTRKEFLDRFEDVRTWFIQRDDGLTEDKKLLQNTFHYHGNIYKDTEHGILFEGAQSIGLHPRYGRYPDVTSTPTDAAAVMLGTRFPGYAKEKIKDRLGVLKLTYNSSVGRVRMITDSGIDRKAYTDEEIQALEDPEQKYAAWIRKEAGEFGTTTGRPRDICFLDLPMLRYNAAAGGIEMLVGTHLDIARSDMNIKVCTHYTNKAGDYVPYQPAIEHQEGLIPQYIELPGWDGNQAKKARSLDEIPENAKRFLAFIQRNTGVPIVMVTNGPKREEMIEFPNYSWN